MCSNVSRPASRASGTTRDSDSERTALGHSDRLPNLFLRRAYEFDPRALCARGRRVVVHDGFRPYREFSASSRGRTSRTSSSTCIAINVSIRPTSRSIRGPHAEGGRLLAGTRPEIQRDLHGPPSWASGASGWTSKSSRSARRRLRPIRSTALDALQHDVTPTRLRGGAFWPSSIFWMVFLELSDRNDAGLEFSRMCRARLDTQTLPVLGSASARCRGLTRDLPHARIETSSRAR